MDVTLLSFTNYYASLSLRFGPLINYWTTRFEAKHKYFKHLANVMGNFVNICYSLALRHHLHQCYLSLNYSATLSGEDTEIGPRMSMRVHKLFHHKSFYFLQLMSTWP